MKKYPNLMILESWLQMKPLLISTPFESRLATLHVILKHTTEELFLRKLLRWVIHDDLAFDGYVRLIAFGFEIGCWKLTISIVLRILAVC
jgi:hypothetical protein